MAFDFSRSIIKNYPGPGLLGPTVHCKRKDSNSAGDNKNDKIFCIILTKKWIVLLGLYFYKDAVGFG